MSAAPIRLKDAKTPEERMRWARWAVRFFARYLPDEERVARGLAPVEYPPPLVVWTASGYRPTPLARMAERWGERVEWWCQAAEIARRGYAVLEEMRGVRR